MPKWQPIHYIYVLLTFCVYFVLFIKYSALFICWDFSIWGFWVVFGISPAYSMVENSSNIQKTHPCTKTRLSSHHTFRIVVCSLINETRQRRQSIEKQTENRKLYISPTWGRPRRTDRNRILQFFSTHRQNRPFKIW